MWRYLEQASFPMSETEYFTLIFKAQLVCVQILIFKKFFSTYVFLNFLLPYLLHLFIVIFSSLPIIHLTENIE